MCGSCDYSDNVVHMVKGYRTVKKIIYIFNILVRFKKKIPIESCQTSLTGPL